MGRQPARARQTRRRAGAGPTPSGDGAAAAARAAKAVTSLDGRELRRLEGQGIGRGSGPGPSPPGSLSRGYPPPTSGRMISLEGIRTDDTLEEKVFGPENKGRTQGEPGNEPQEREWLKQVTGFEEE